MKRKIAPLSCRHFISVKSDQPNTLNFSKNSFEKGAFLLCGYNDQNGFEERPDCFPNRSRFVGIALQTECVLPEDVCRTGRSVVTMTGKRSVRQKRPPVSIGGRSSSVVRRFAALFPDGCLVDPRALEHDLVLPFLLYGLPLGVGAEDGNQNPSVGLGQFFIR